MNVSQLVLERLDSHGWQKRRSGGALGPNCLTGALGWILFDDESLFVQLATESLDHLASLHAGVGLVRAVGERFMTTRISAKEVQDLWHSIIMEQFPERATGNGTTVVEFNDHPDTTIADVCAVLEKASAIEDERISASDHAALNGRSMASLT